MKTIVFLIFIIVGLYNVTFSINIDGFVPNYGQWSPSILACYFSNKYKIAFNNDGSFTLNTFSNEKKLSYSIRIYHQNSNIDFDCLFENKYENYHVNYIIGNNPSAWKSKIPVFKKLVLKNIYDDIDVVFYIDNGSVRFDYYVYGFGNYQSIILSIDDSKNFIIESDNLYNSILLNYFDFGNNTKENLFRISDIQSFKISNRFNKIKTSIVQNNNSFSFKLSSSLVNHYDLISGDTLVIDPLIYSTFLGAIGGDTNRDMVVLPDESVVVLGNSNNNSFPVTTGVYDMSHNGLNDIVVSKISPDGSSLIFSTFIGGSGNENAGAIKATIGFGSFIICGFTDSPDFPIIIPTFQAVKDAGEDGFICKLNFDGSVLLNSTFFGRNGNDRCWSCDINNGNEVYVTGLTTSSNFHMSITTYDMTYNGSDDIFVSKLNADLNNLIASTYLGGTCAEAASIYVDKTLDIPYLTGNTCSSDFPVLPGSYDVTFNGSYDCFISAFNSDLTSLISSTFIGGSGIDYGLNLVQCMDGTMAICGLTSSSNFPTSIGAFDNSHNSSNDGFVLKITPDGFNLLYSTYLGGSNNDVLFNIKENPAAHLGVTGYSNSNNFPVTAGAYDVTHNGNNDVIYSRLNINLSTLLYSSFIGGVDTDDGYQLEYVSNDDVIICGHTFSSNFPVTTGVYDPTFNGGVDEFIFRLDDQITPLADTSLSVSLSCNNDYLMLCLNNVLLDTIYCCYNLELTNNFVAFQTINLPPFNKSNCIGLTNYNISNYSYYRFIIQNANFSQSSPWFLVPDCIQNSDKLLIYPNPTNHSIYIYSEFSDYVKLNDALGQVLMVDSINTGVNQFDLSLLAPGIYLLSINEKTFKIIKY